MKVIKHPDCSLDIMSDPSLLDVVISCFPQRWQPDLEHKESAQGTGSDIDTKESEFLSRHTDQDESNKMFSRTTDQSEPPRIHPLSSPLPKTPLHTPQAPALSGVGGPPIIVNFPREGRPERRKKGAPAGVLGQMSSKSTTKSSSARRNSRQGPDVQNWMSGAVRPSGKDPEKEAKESSLANNSDNPATVDDSHHKPTIVPALSDSAPPPNTVPPQEPPSGVENEASLEYQDTEHAQSADQQKESNREQSRNRSRSSSDRESKAYFLSSYDPMDVHQRILNHLKRAERAPITTIYELANLITNTCVNVFDQYTVPDAFQFLDFFERSIGNIVGSHV